MRPWACTGQDDRKKLDIHWADMTVVCSPFPISLPEAHRGRNCQPKIFKCPLMRFQTYASSCLIRTRRVCQCTIPVPIREQLVRANRPLFTSCLGSIRGATSGAVLPGRLLSTTMLEGEHWSIDRLEIAANIELSSVFTMAGSKVR
jgi:hypothetical protein